MLLLIATAIKEETSYDLVFLMSKDVVPDYNYLDMELMAKDVEPFLFDTFDLEKVVHFDDVLCQYSF